jgi:hypothetical protein
VKTEQGRSGRSPCTAPHGAPEHALAAVAVVRVRMEEPRRGRGQTAEAEDVTESGGEERGDGGEEDGQDRHGGAPAAVGGGPLGDGGLDGAGGRWLVGGQEPVERQGTGGEGGRRREICARPEREGNRR